MHDTQSASFHRPPNTQHAAAAQAAANAGASVGTALHHSESAMQQVLQAPGPQKQHHCYKPVPRRAADSRFATVSAILEDLRQQSKCGAPLQQAPPPLSTASCGGGGGGVGGGSSGSIISSSKGAGNIGGGINEPHADCAARWSTAGGAQQSTGSCRRLWSVQTEHR
jgi:hypothetical protein